VLLVLYHQAYFSIQKNAAFISEWVRVWKNKVAFGFVLASLRVLSAMTGGTLVLFLLPLFDLNMTFKLICMFRLVCTPFCLCVGIILFNMERKVEKKDEQCNGALE